MSRKRLPREPGYRYSLLPEERAAIMERSGGKCEQCGATQEDRPADWPAKRTFIETHHKVQVAEGGGNSPENVEMLCHPCHLAIPVRKIRKRQRIVKGATLIHLTHEAFAWLKEMAAENGQSNSVMVEKLIRTRAVEEKREGAREWK